MVESIKSSLLNYTKVIASVQWKVEPYETARVAENMSMKNESNAQELRTRHTESLFDAIEAGSVSRILEVGDLGAVIHVSKTVSINLQDLEPQIALFYSTMTGGKSSSQVAEKKRKTERRKKPVFPKVTWLYDPKSTSSAPLESDPDPSPVVPPSILEPPRLTNRPTEQTEENQLLTTLQSVSIEMTPLTWLLFTLRKDEWQTRYEILETLLYAGANIHARDATGLCAYDHARILKLDEDTIDKLNPFKDVQQGGSSGLLDAIRMRNSSVAAYRLQRYAAPLMFDENNLSPLALATHVKCPEIIPKLLEVGFSPFAVYNMDTAYYPSLAFACISGLAPATLSANLLMWIRSKERVVGTNEREWVSQALDIECRAVKLSRDNWAYAWGDILVLSVLLNKRRCVHLCMEQSITTLVRKVHSVSWAMYAAIRCGNVSLVDLLLSNPLRMAASDLDKRHPLSSWWPWPCTCEKDVHSVESGSLLDYAKSLCTSALCPLCKDHRREYQAIALRLQQRRNKTALISLLGAHGSRSRDGVEEREEYEGIDLLQ